MRSYLILTSLFFFIIITITRAQIRNSTPQSFIKPGTPEKAGFSSERLKRIDEFFEFGIKNNIVPHSQCLIVRNGQIVYFKSFGWKDAENKILLKNDDIFRLASQTKAITTIGMMILFEKGLINLNDPVSKYIPAFKDIMVQKKQNNDFSESNLEKAEKPITIHHLLTHTSGIPYYYDPKYFSSVTSPGMTMNDVTLEQFINEITQMPLVHQPGEALTYGYNLDIIGFLIEKISGTKLDEFLRKNIFDPLGIKDIHFYLPENKAGRLVNLYEKERADGPISKSKNDLFTNYPVKGAKKFLSGGAGLNGTIEDYAKICQMLLNGGSFNGVQILSPKSIEMMCVNQVGALPLWDTGNHFGLGFEIMTEKGLTNLLGTAGSYKWGGMFGTEYVIDPKENLFMIFYSNVYPFADKTEILNKFRVLVYQAMIK
jgi:CubicO group peptidase (beta-lactamase class C family)